MKFLAPILFVLALSAANAAEKKDRNGKVLSLFNIVTFKNEVCTTKSTSDARNGTCYTTTECTNKGGSAQGNCAAGFGVCCYFSITAGSSSTSENNSYVQNPSYPSAYTATTALSYTIKKCSEDICAIRLDFETFTIDGPTTTTEAADTTATDNCVDSFVVTGTSGITAPRICGTNTGQHMYIDIGAAATDQATLTFTFATSASTTRTWDIKVAQIPCAANYRPPAGCLQWHTGVTGVLKTFNFDATTYMHLPDQDYSICIRQEAGYCCVEYTPTNDPNSFSIGNTAALGVDSACTEDYVGIEGSAVMCSEDGFPNVNTVICGWLHTEVNTDATTGLTTVCDCTAPFVVSIYTDGTADAIQAINRGVALEYRQVPCSN